jgi:hypothetical protein
MEAESSDRSMESNSIDYWHLSDELTVVQCALLILGLDPSLYAPLELQQHTRPAGYEAITIAISNALRKGAIQGAYISHQVPGDPIDVEESRVEVESLRAWLCERGYRTGFFFPAASSTPDYLDPSNPRYAPRLAAAVRAWEAVTDSKGKAPKQALIKWLREHAAEFSLSLDDGKPNETGIEEVAKVANWNPGGGAPKTPSVSGG